MKKELEIGKDYSGIFGLDSDKNQLMIYLGNNEWLGCNGKKELKMISIEQTQNALEYINRSSSSTPIIIGK